MIPAEWTVNQHAGRCYHVHGRIMGGKMRVPLAFVALVALLSVSISAADSTPAGRLAGVVTDSEGAAISNAVVVVHWDTHGADAVRGSVPGLTEDLRLTTDKAGRILRGIGTGVLRCRGVCDGLFLAGFQAAAQNCEGRAFQNQIGGRPAGVRGIL